MYLIKMYNNFLSFFKVPLEVTLTKKKQQTETQIRT